MNLKETESDNSLHFTGWFKQNQNIVNLHDDMASYQVEDKDRNSNKNKNHIHHSDTPFDKLDEKQAMEFIFNSLDEKKAALSLNERQIQGQETKLALLSLIMGSSVISLTVTGIATAIPHVPGYHPIFNIAIVPILVLVSMASGYFWSNTIFHLWTKKNRFLNRLKEAHIHLKDELNAFKLEHGL